MRVCILGAGVIGVVTAYYLAKSGHRVTVIEKEVDVAARSSFANAGQLSYSYTDGAADPQIIKKIPSILCNRDPSFWIAKPPSVELMRWGVGFIKECRKTKAIANMLRLLRMAEYSRIEMAKIVEHANVEAMIDRSGKLIITSRRSSLSTLIERSELKRRAGCDIIDVTPNQIVSIEPALEDYKRKIVGGVYAPNDATGDARDFAQNLAKYLQNDSDVHFCYKEKARCFNIRDGAAKSVETDMRTYNADAFIICTGADSSGMLRNIGISNPIYPIKGYSVSFDYGEKVPGTAVTDLDRKIVFSRLGERIRVSGNMDFEDYNPVIREGRTNSLISRAMEVMPRAADFEQPRLIWTGFRPQTRNGLPMIGTTEIGNVLINIGHGMLGWTLAAVSGWMIGRILAGESEREIWKKFVED